MAAAAATSAGAGPWGAESAGSGEDRGEEEGAEAGDDWERAGSTRGSFQIDVLH